MDLKTAFEPYTDLKNGSLEAKKDNNNLKIKSISNVVTKGNLEIKRC